MKYWYLMLLILTSLIGCASTKTETVTVVKNVYVEVPNELLERCSVTHPPAVSEYKSMPQGSKEYVLTMYATSLLQDVAVCDQKISKIQQWSRQQSTIFNTQVKPLEVRDAKLPGPK